MSRDVSYPVLRTRLPAFSWGFTPFPSFAGSRGSQFRHPTHLINAWAIVACLTSPNTGFRAHRSLEHPLRFLTKYRVKNLFPHSSPSSPFTARFSVIKTPLRFSPVSKSGKRYSISNMFKPGYPHSYPLNS